MNERVSHDVASSLLQQLVRSGAIKQFQADQLSEFIGQPEDLVWTRPWLRDIKEHTRAYLDGALRQRSEAESQSGADGS